MYDEMPSTKVMYGKLIHSLIENGWYSIHSHSWNLNESKLQFTSTCWFTKPLLDYPNGCKWNNIPNSKDIKISYHILQQ
jgi:hypothetical protein